MHIQRTEGNRAAVMARRLATRRGTTTKLKVAFNQNRESKNQRITLPLSSFEHHYRCSPWSISPVSHHNVAGAARKRPRAGSASHQISVRLTAMLLIPLGKSTEPGVSSGLGTGFRNGELCWPSCVSIDRGRNVGLKADLYKERRVLS